MQDVWLPRPQALRPYVAPALMSSCVKCCRLVVILELLLIIIAPGEECEGHVLGSVCPRA